MNDDRKIKKEKAFAMLRIVFGFLWLIDAAYKWSPSSISLFVNYLLQGAAGQGAAVQTWVNFWVVGMRVGLYFFAIVIAIAETAIALGLIFGVFTQIAMVGGLAMLLVIWSTAQSFGGAYIPGSMDVGAVVTYVIMFAALWIGKSWRHYSLDSLVEEKIPFFHWLW